MYNCYLTCPRGLEKQAQIDLKSYISNSSIGKGGIEFNTDQTGLYNVNLHSRIGMHLLVKIFEINVKDTEEAYTQIYGFNWHEIINPKQTFIIKLKGQSDNFNNNNYLTLKIKDAIVDQIKKKRFSRPSIDKKNPNIILNVFISNDRLTIYLDSSGLSLHKRGYRNKIHKAMLNESLAAGLIMLSNWNQKDPFYDLMCGSGTIPIEAALIAHKIAPGLLRENFAFMQWDDFDEKLFIKLKKKAEKKISINPNIKIYGFDRVFTNIAISLSSIKSVGYDRLVDFKKQDISKFTPVHNYGVIIMNPPYGERLDESDEVLQQLYGLIGDTLKQKCVGFEGYIFTSNLEMAKFIGLKSKQRIVLKNGKLDCRLLHYPIKSGEFD